MTDRLRCDDEFIAAQRHEILPFFARGS